MFSAKWSAALMLLLASGAYAAEKPIVPRSIGEMGFLTTQPGVVFGEGTTLLYFNETNYRLRNEQFKYHDSASLRRLATLNAAYFTEQQMRWNGILMNVQKQPTGQRVVFAGSHHGRGSVTGYLEEHQIFDSVLPVIGDGVAERKGTGITAVAEERLVFWSTMAKVLAGQGSGGLDATSPEARKGIQANIDANQAHIDEIRGKMADWTWDVRMAANREISRMEAESELFALYLKGLTEIDATKAVEATTMEAFLKKLAAKDYLNGLFEASRGLVEAMLYEIFVDVYAILNEVWGTSLGVVPVDLVVALPVKMNSISYGEEQYAGVMERPAVWRGAHPREEGVDVELRYWSPRTLIRTDGTYLDQHDVNGYNIDLELMTAQIPGLDEYFRKQYRGFYGDELHRLCIEATKAAIAGDETAVPSLIRELKGAIDRDALREWANKNRPPKDFGRDPFSVAREILNRTERVAARSDSKALAKSKKQVAGIDLSTLRRAVDRLYKDKHLDQVTALLPSLYRLAPEVASDLWKKTLTDIRVAAVEGRKAVEAGGPPAAIQLDHTLQLLAMMVFHWESGDKFAPVKARHARELFETDAGIFEQVYGILAAEAFRRRLAVLKMYPPQFYAGNDLYDIALVAFGRAAHAMMLDHGAPIGSYGQTYGEVLLFRAGEGVIRLADLIEQLTGNHDPFFALQIVEAVEHILGMEMSDRVTGDLFPILAPAVDAHLELQRQLESMHPADMMGCILRMAAAAGEDPGENADEIQAALSGGFLRTFLGRMVEPGSNRQLPPTEPPTPPALPPTKPK